MQLVRWLIFSAAVFGVLTIDTSSLKWSILQTILFCVPLLALLTASVDAKIWALWMSGFLVLQSLLAPFLIDSNLKTLPPNLKQIVDIKGGLPGLSGKQFLSTDHRGFRTTDNVDYKAKDTFRIFCNWRVDNGAEIY